MAQDARRTEEHSTQRRSHILGMNYFDSSVEGEKDLYKAVLTIEQLHKYRVIPLRADPHNILFGVVNTTSQQTMEEVRSLFPDQRVTFALISDTGFREYMRLYDPPKKVEYQDIELNTAGNEDLIRQVSETLEKVRADDMLAYLVHQAHRLAASDIHVEHQKEYVRIRFRIDGVLHPIARLTIEKNRALIGAIASGADVSTYAEGAQQGHIAQRIKMADESEVDINLRVETVPAVSGMDVVMRLFNLNPEMYRLDKLELSEAERAVVDKVIAKPSGLAMMVGPTGSGKTTTLYSVLNTLNTDERKIITIEDPVEYQFEGITQIPVKTKGIDDMTFADRLRAVLRLDPDVVMVGEIRDMDTARTALQASLTGHLVLSTFHASSASAALTRIMDIIGENPLFLSAIRLVMAQRLVRKLDPDTKQPYQADEATIRNIQGVIDTLPPGWERPDLTNLTLYNPGTSEDNPYGFRGQTPLREQFVMDDKIIQVLQDRKKVSTTEDIEAAAIQNGMLTMLQDGILKVVRGETTLEEVYRVLGT